MRAVKGGTPGQRLKSTSLMLRLILHGDELFRLPAGSRSVQVVSGVAWLTAAGDDIFLKSGERLWLLADKNSALISALGRVPLILEVFGDRTSSRPGRLIAPPQGRPGTI